MMSPPTKSHAQPPEEPWPRRTARGQINYQERRRSFFRQPRIAAARARRCGHAATIRPGKDPDVQRKTKQRMEENRNVGGNGASAEQNALRRTSSRPGGRARKRQQARTGDNSCRRASLRFGSQLLPSQLGTSKTGVFRRHVRQLRKRRQKFTGEPPRASLAILRWISDAVARSSRALPARRRTWPADYYTTHAEPGR